MHARSTGLHFELMGPTTFDSTMWPEGVIQLLDEHHLVVLSDSPPARHAFAKRLAEQLSAIEQTHVAMIDGTVATDLVSFCRQLERSLSSQAPAERLVHPNPMWRDIQSVIELLRTACSGHKRCYLIWNDADAMLEADVELFSQVVNALVGVAAEFEHISIEPLVLMRVVFIGGSKLGAYAEDVNGQFCKWLEDQEDSPFWEIMSVVDRPPVITYRIDG
jgi:hypothetical protein